MKKFFMDPDYNEIPPVTPSVSKKYCYLVSFAAVLFGLLVGICMTYVIMRDKRSLVSEIINNAHISPEKPLIKNENKASDNTKIRQKIFDNINSKSIGHWLEIMTMKPQLAGTEVDREMAQYMLIEWNLMGLNASLVNYTVLLSYPDINKPNLVRKFDKNGEISFISKEFEEPLNASADESVYYKTNPPFLAYSASTKQPVKGNLVYVNYGRVEDYDYLKQLNISVRGNIAIVRYGKIFRANIVKLAENNGAIGLIIYSDPHDYTDGKTDNTYPNSVYLPKSGVQRGTVQLSDGDPMTPFYPSIDSAYRLPTDKLNLPQIPAQSISYGDAINILEGLDGPTAPHSWIGGLNITYNLGPGHKDGGQISVEVNNRLQERLIYNVIGIINGCTEPDRYVLVGNHRDSWTFGSVDPSSGTAAMLELTKAFTYVMKTENWCPSRSIVFCSWAAEEYGLIGSTEWVEENKKLLQSQAIAYLNVDIAVEGNFTLRAKSVPTLYETVWNAAKFVENPDPSEVKAGRHTVYDTWLYRSPNNMSIKPKISNPGSGSDHNPFLQITGVPVIDFRYSCDQSTGIKCNPLYHTMYETYYLQSNLLDKGFKFNTALTKIWSEMIRSLSDSAIIPFSIQYYPELLKNAIIELKKSKYSHVFLSENISLDHLDMAVDKFENAVNQLIKQIESIDSTNALRLRGINDILMQMERAFIDELGLPFRKDYKHVILAASSINSYSGSTFSGIYDILWKFTHEVIEKNKLQLLEEIKHHLSVIVYHINCAQLLLAQSLYRI